MIRTVFGCVSHWGLVKQVTHYLVKSALTFQIAR